MVVTACIPGLGKPKRAAAVSFANEAFRSWRMKREGGAQIPSTELQKRVGGRPILPSENPDFSNHRLKTLRSLLLCEGKLDQCELADVAHVDR